MAEESVRDRCLRSKRRHSYQDDGIGDDEIYGQRTFDLQSKLKSYPDDDTFYNEMKGCDVTLAYFQENGFNTPILVKEKTGLGMRMPSENFTVNDVKKCVGSWRLVDVMDVTTQKDMEMTMKEWTAYYENLQRDRLLNVISLEFSHTKLENYVDQPAVVHDLDWVDLAWPNYLKEMQTSATNQISSMKYPKVQKYCLMSVGGCYTDFHIDMGGTSVWYHIIRGKKVFWFIEPTEDNLKLYENWTLSAKQSEVFFGDLVKKCYRITLEAGNTFFIPTGWIHAVYTPCDSLVFGGNFLHSFNIELQLRIWEVETKTHVPMKFRYPFFIELHWYVLERYLFALSGRQYSIKVDEPVKEESLMDTSTADDYDVDGREKNKEEDIFGNPTDLEKATFSPTSTLEAKPYKFLTSYELNGLQLIAYLLQNLSQNKRCVPKDIINPDQLLLDLQKLLGFKEVNNHNKAITGIPLLDRPIVKKVKKYNTTGSRCGTSSKASARPTGSSIFGSVWNYRRVRCKQCEPCTRSDCGECYACLDMKKFGGPGTLKKPCLSRQCMQPILPATAVCFTCKKPTENKTCIEPGVGLLECTICFEVHHRDCLEKVLGDSMTHRGGVDEDFPSSWECARCCSRGRQGQGRTRFRPPALPPGESRRRASKKHDGSGDHKAIEKTADESDSETSIFDESRSSQSFDQRHKKVKPEVSLSGEPAAKKCCVEDQSLPDLQLRHITQSRVVLTRLKTDSDSVHSQDTAKDDEEEEVKEVTDHIYSSKFVKDSPPIENNSNAKERATEGRIGTNRTCKTLRENIGDGSNEVNSVEGDRGTVGVDENDESSTNVSNAQKLSSRGRIISKPNRYKD